MKLPAALRWALVPVVSMGGCSGTVVLSDAFGRGAARVITPDVFNRIEAVIPTDVRIGLLYAIAAAAWVLAGAAIAPRRRIAVALMLYVAGAYLAWGTLHDWYFPEGHPRGYQRSRVPLVLTLVGGLLGAAMFIIAWRRGSPTTSVGLEESTVPGQERAG
jgi:hypothetical protein